MSGRERRIAVDAIDQALVAMGQRERTPCWDPANDRELWTSDVVEDRQAAIILCGPCPVRDPCRLAALARGIQHGSGERPTSR
jgi:Transcription factor WhiB